jgi:hypothetical protein
VSSRARVAILLALLPAQYLFEVARHEGCHALAATLTGTRVVDVHLWPPRWPELSWTTLLPAGPRPPGAVAFEAGLPHLVAALSILATSAWIAGQRGLGLLGWNVLLAGAVFPWLDLAVVAASWWVAPTDLFWVFGAGTGARLLVCTWVVALGGCVLWTARAALRRAPEEER